MKKGKLGKNIKVGKNQIYKDWDGICVVEKFEYMQGKTPMYSTYDSYKTKVRAMSVAKRIK